jgi:hypothetical protein
MAGAQIQNLSQFQNELENALSQLSEDQIPVAVKKIVLDALRGFVLGTRVDTGRARGGWQISLNRPQNARGNRLDKTGTSTINSGLGKLSSLSADDVVYIQNQVVYIGILENLDHMVENTLNRLIARLKAGNI